LAGCITNTSSRPPARDTIFADYRTRSLVDHTRPSSGFLN
jgi:hypothetical protein